MNRKTKEGAGKTSSSDEPSDRAAGLTILGFLVAGFITGYFLFK